MGNFRLMYADLTHEAFCPLPQGFLSHGQYTPISGSLVALMPSVHPEAASMLHCLCSSSTKSAKARMRLTKKKEV